ncbi:transcriptional coactivator/pterin dehydratase [Wolffia australiana]
MAASAGSAHLLFLHLQRRPRAAVAGPLAAAPLRGRLRCAAMGADLLGDFGARDPFPEEIESNFGEKVVGFSSTEHKILIPIVSALSLAERSCEPVPSSQAPFSFSDAEKLLRKIVGWKLVEEEGLLKIQGIWKLRDRSCGEELISRINAVVEPLSHRPTIRLEEPNQVIAELWTDSIGGLSLNDFIVAAKIDQIETKDLLPRKRVWA